MSADNKNAPFGYTTNGRPVPGGFTGTVPEFLDWLSDHLAYGGLSVSEPIPDEFQIGKMVREVSLVTAGYSDDEKLIGRVGIGAQSYFALRFFNSCHAGGLYIYHVPVEDFDSDRQICWLDEPTDTILETHRARTLTVRDINGDTVSFEVPFGAEICFTEEDLDVMHPYGELTIRAFTEPDPIWDML